MAFGVTPQGFVKKRLVDVKKEIETSLRDSMGRNINLLPESVFGQIVGIMAEREALIWEGMEDAYNSQYPDTAEGVALDNVGAIVGIARIGARATRQEALHLLGTPGAVIPQGTLVEVPGVGNAVFSTEAAVTLVAGVDEVQTITFSGVPTGGSWRLKFIDELTTLLDFDASALDVEQALNDILNLEDIAVAGDYTAGFTITFGGASGKADHVLLESLDNTLGETITIVETTKGVPQGLVDATCLATGVVPAFAFSLTGIVTPVTGLSSVVNLVDAIVGRDVETDIEYRVRRNNSLQIAGSATLDAIRSELLQVENVLQVLVFENVTLVADENGLPGKSFAAYVDGGDDQDIADTIFAVKPAGILAHGDVVGTVVDSQGFDHEIKFFRPIGLDIWIELDISTGPSFPANGAQLIQDAIVAHGNGLGIGNSVIVVPDLLCALDSVQGITDVDIRIGTAASPVLDANIDVQPQEVTRWAPARTMVTVV